MNQGSPAGYPPRVRPLGPVRPHAPTSGPTDSPPAAPRADRPTPPETGGLGARPRPAAQVGLGTASPARALDARLQAFGGTLWTLADFKGLNVDLGLCGPHYTPVDQGFVDRWNQHVRVRPSEFFEQLMDGVPGQATIDMELGEKRGSMSVEVKNGHQPVLKAARALDFETGTATHHRLDVSASGRGLGKVWMRNSVALYEKMGMRRVEIPTAERVGSYAWARFGFLPTPESWSELRSQLAARLKDAPNPQLEALCASEDRHALWKISDHADARTLLEGTAWAGALDLRDGAQRLRFQRYVERG